MRWALVKFSQFTAIVIIFCNKMRCSKAEFKILLENFITILTKENLVYFFVTEETSPFQSHCQKAERQFYLLEGGRGGHLYIFEAGCLLTFPVYRVGSYLRLGGKPVIQGGCLFEVWCLIE